MALYAELALEDAIIWTCLKTDYKMNELFPPPGKLAVNSQKTKRNLKHLLEFLITFQHHIQ